MDVAQALLAAAPALLSAQRAKLAWRGVAGAFACHAMIFGGELAEDLNAKS